MPTTPGMAPPRLPRRVLSGQSRAGRWGQREQGMGSACLPPGGEGPWAGGGQVTCSEERLCPVRGPGAQYRGDLGRLDSGPRWPPPTPHIRIVLGGWSQAGRPCLGQGSGPSAAQGCGPRAGVVHPAGPWASGKVGRGQPVVATRGPGSRAVVCLAPSPAPEVRVPTPTPQCTDAGPERARPAALGTLSHRSLQRTFHTVPIGSESLGLR